jgi:predicted DNA-binding transcriptional regulator YafY
MTSEAFSAATPPMAWARLLFTPERTRRLPQDLWHSRQESHLHPDGSREVSFPYSDDPALLDDILLFGPDVEVLAPQALRLNVQRRLLAAIGRYASGADPGIFP